jgi:hypothetical protein
MHKEEFLNVYIKHQGDEVKNKESFRSNTHVGRKKCLHFVVQNIKNEQKNTFKIWS